MPCDYCKAVAAEFTTSLDSIFASLVIALDERGVSDYLKYVAINGFVEAFVDEDWHPGETLKEFCDDMIVVAALYNGMGDGILLGWEDDSEVSHGAKIRVNDTVDEWVLTTLDEDGDAGIEIVRAPFTAEGHNLLIDLWAKHCIEAHGSVDDSVQNAKLPVA